MICRTVPKFLNRNELNRLEETCSHLISICNSKSLKEGICVHSPIIKLGLYGNLYLSNNLLTLYAKRFGLKQARNLFDEMPDKDVVSWTTMQAAYVRNRSYIEAFELFDLMVILGHCPNEFTLSTLLRSCSETGELELGACVHGYAIKGGFESKPVLGCTLIDMYAKCDCTEEACEVFRNMDNADTVTWTATISSLVQAQKWNEALQLYITMIESGVTPNEFTFTKLLATINFLDLKYGKLLHNHVITFGVDLNVLLKTTLVDMYSRYQELEDAMKVANQTAEKDVHLWTSIISCFNQNLKVKEAIATLQEMRISGIPPNSFTYSSVLSACTLIPSLELGKQIHLQVILAGLEADVCAGSALINMYMKCSDSINDALRVFRTITSPNVICWTSLISGLAEHGCEQDCYRYFLDMQAAGVQPNSFTLSSILGACSSAKSQNRTSMFHGYILKIRAHHDIIVGNALVDAYARSRMVDEAWRVISTMNHRDAITYTSLATRLNQMGDHEMALKTISSMRDDNVRKDEVSLASLISAATGLGTVKIGEQLHCYSLKYGLYNTRSVKNSLIDLYGKVGCLKDAQKAFEEITEPDVVSWNGMISVLALNGHVSSALSAFDNMRLAGLKPDSITFLLILSACSQGGLVDFGMHYFQSMREIHYVEPELDHYVCLVDLLGRAGQLEKAMEVVESMPFEADAKIYKTLLSACKLHKNMLLGEDVARRGLQLDPYDSSFYLLLANLYDELNRPDLSKETRKLMRDRGVRKSPSQSWTELSNSIHLFITGDRSHPQINDIQEKLEFLKAEFKVRGFLYHGDENSSHHSEKLALAFGLINLPPKAVIRIMKNISICRECHDFILLVTKVAEREIVVRDGSRLHVFKNGSCSCRHYSRS
ncbi:pentatricopeptide repeat-containing protein At5g52850, chloroplastic [Momordica charantia]|uniref:Pentatricopeptide repeat-containing protein At5g52850, chloroplastic n=1 Tax=Momordica charantia TaxID=3673 RepID=A0A6J1CHG9_MOMCH|nr:pentatricopeptide repeat-containing protein At5g52850, chloroplastic [Momordica charantia]